MVGADRANGCKALPAPHFLNLTVALESLHVLRAAFSEYARRRWRAVGEKATAVVQNAGTGGRSNSLGRDEIGHLSRFAANEAKASASRRTPGAWTPRTKLRILRGFP
jgi:hypothetical protein